MNKTIVITGQGILVRAFINKEDESNYLIYPEVGLDPNEQGAFITEYQGDKKIISMSSYIISDAHEVFEVQEDLSLALFEEFMIFGASSNKINMKLFKRRSTIGDFAIGKMRKVDSVEELDDNFGESIEKIIMMKSFDDKEKSL